MESAPTRALVCLALAACTEHRDLDLEGTQSLSVELVDTATGTKDARLPDDQRAVKFTITARTVDGEIDTSFTGPVALRTQYLGTLTPAFGAAPLASIQLTAGVAADQTLVLPEAILGPTTLWVDDGTGVGTSFVHGKLAGASAVLWYRDPYIRDIQEPRSETALDALSVSRLQDKQITVNASRHGAAGRLVITSVGAQGYTVSDVRCADEAGTPPCTAEAYDHAYVYTYSAGRGSDGHLLEQGEAIDGFAGGVAEFNGLTEIGFPQTFTPAFMDADGDDVNDAIVLARQPAPAVLDAAWFGPLSEPTGRINFERNEAGAIEIDGAKICALDEDYDTYKQWKIEVDGDGMDCGNSNTVINVITTGISGLPDPRTFTPGTTLARIVGVLRPVNIGSFNVWIIYPRSASDLTL